MDLKPYLAAVETADAEVKQIEKKIDAFFSAGKNNAALALRPALDKARAYANGAYKLYLSMRDADAGRTWRHCTNPGAEKMTRIEFDKLEASKRMNFILAGGQITT